MRVEMYQENTYTLLFANHLVHLDENLNDINYMMRKFMEERSIWGYVINTDDIWCMAVEYERKDMIKERKKVRAK